MHDRIRKHLAPYVRAAGVQDTAAAIGVSQPSLSRWLRGDYQFSLDKLAALAKATGCRLTITLADADGHQKTYR